MIYARIPIYQALTHPWKRSGMPTQAVLKIVKKVYFVILSFSFLGLTQDSLDRSPWFEYKSTPFRSAHVSDTFVLCYHDSDLIVGVYSAFVSGCVWFTILSYNVHAHIMYCHGEVMWQKSVALHATASIVCVWAELTELEGASMLDHEKLLF